MIPRLFSHLPNALGETPNTYLRGACDVGDGFVFSVNDGATNRTVFTKVGNDGYVKWQRQHAGNNQDVGQLLSDGVGGCYMLGDMSILRIDGSGALTWSRWSSYEGSHLSGALSSWGISGCLLAHRNGKDADIISVNTDGTVVSERTYVGITGEEPLYRPRLVLANDASGYMLASRINGVSEDYLRLTKISSALNSVSLTKSYKIASSDSYWYLYDACSAAGNMVFGFVVGSPASALRLMCVHPDGSVYWTKHLTDTGIADFDWAGANLYGAASGFFAVSYDDTDGAAVFCFDDAGALQWSKTIKCSDTPLGGSVNGVTKLANGTVLISITAQDTTTGAFVAGCLLLNSDGTYNSTFLSGIVEVTDRAGVTVSSGTIPTVANDTAGTITARTTTLVDSALTLTTTDYTVVSLYPDDFQSSQASGHKAIHHGQANSPYTQSGQATGTLETAHGIAMSAAHLPSGATLCAAVGNKATKHGRATGASSVTSAATGNLATKHGTAQGKAIYAATGTRAVAHGTASLSSLFHATGHRATKHGIATTLLSRAMTGHLATKHGTMASEWRATGQMSGHLATLHGTASSKCIFKVTPSFKTRHGTPKAIRSITC